MPKTRMRERNQLTLPSSITAAAGIRPNDSLEINYTNGVITIVPVTPQKKANNWNRAGIPVTAY